MKDEGEGKRVSQGSHQAGRALSPVAVWAIALGCVVGWGCFVMPATTFLPAAGPLGTAIAFVLGTLAVLVVAMSYGYLAKLYPGKPGVYAYTHRAFGPNQAFVCSWCLVLAYSAGMISNTTALALVLRSVFGEALQFGFHYVIVGYDVFFGELLVAFVATVLAALVCIRGVRAIGVVQSVLVVGMVLGACIIGFVAFASPQFSFEALSPAFSPDASRLAGVIAVLAVAPFAFIGFEVAFQESEECRFQPDKMGLIVVVAILCGAAMYLLVNTVTAGSVPEGFANWHDYLSAVPGMQGIAALPTFNAAYVLAGNVGVTLLGVTALCAVLTGVLGFYLAATRLIYIMAKDGAIVSSLSREHPAYGTPIAAIVIVLGVGLIVPFLDRTVLGWAVDLMSLGALVAYSFICATTFKLAREQDNKPMLVLGTVGVVIGCIMTAVLFVPLPGLGSSLSRESYIILVAWVALGVNFFTPSQRR